MHNGKSFKYKWNTGCDQQWVQDLTSSGLVFFLPFDSAGLSLLLLTTPH